jgi:hypothetical protein
METIQKEHPLTTTQTLAAFTAAALFWGVGVTMIDPHIGVGILLCIIGFAATFWLFWASIKIMPHTHIGSWPWLGLALLLIEVTVPGYIFYARADELSKTPPPGGSIQQQGGQTGGTINNSGPVYNGPVKMNENTAKPPVSVLKISPGATADHITIKDGVFPGADQLIDNQGTISNGDFERLVVGDPKKKR